MSVNDEMAQNDENSEEKVPGSISHESTRVFVSVAIGLFSAMSIPSFIDNDLAQKYDKQEHKVSLTNVYRLIVGCHVMNIINMLLAYASTLFDKEFSQGFKYAQIPFLYLSTTFYWVGGCLLTNAYDNLSKGDTAYSAAIFFEYTLVTLLLLFLLVDIIISKLDFSSGERTFVQKWAPIVMYTLFFNNLFVLSVCYFSTKTYQVSTNVIGSGFLLYLIFMICFLLYRHVLKKENQLTVVFVCLHWLGALIAAGGYWSMNLNKTNQTGYYSGVGMLIFLLDTFSALRVLSVAMGLPSIEKDLSGVVMPLPVNNEEYLIGQCAGCSWHIYYTPSGMKEASSTDSDKREKKAFACSNNECCKLYCACCLNSNTLCSKCKSE